MILDALIFVIIIIGAGIPLTVIAYAMSRAASLGWHKGKYEHLRRVLHITKGENPDG